jgi:hypothetical protein
MLPSRKLKLRAINSGYLKTKRATLCDSFNLQLAICHLQLAICHSQLATWHLRPLFLNVPRLQKLPHQTQGDIRRPLSGQARMSAEAAQQSFYIVLDH